MYGSDVDREIKRRGGNNKRQQQHHHQQTNNKRLRHELRALVLY